jgi:hypothetical protein
MLLQVIDSNAALVASVATLTSSLAILSVTYTILASGINAPTASNAPAAACTCRRMHPLKLQPCHQWVLLDVQLLGWQWSQQFVLLKQSCWPQGHHHMH